MERRYIWLSLGAGLLLFFLLIHNLNWSRAAEVLSIGRGEYLYVYFGVSVLILVSHTVRWRFIMRSKGIDIPFWRALSYRYAGFAVSFVTPGPKIGGEPVRASLVTRHRTRTGKRVKFSQAFSTIIIDRATEIQTFALLFFIGVLTLAIFGQIPGHFKYPLIVASSLLLALTIVFVANTAYGRPFALQVLKRLPLSRAMKREVLHFEKTVVSFYRHERFEFAVAHLISVITWFLSFVEYKYLLLFLGFDVPLWAIFIIYSSVGLAYMVPVPLALGVLEGTQAATFGLLGLNPGAGIILALITRLRDLVFTVVGFMALVYHGISAKQLKKAVR